MLGMKRTPQTSPKVEAQDPFTLLIQGMVGQLLSNSDPAQFLTWFEAEMTKEHSPVRLTAPDMPRDIMRSMSRQMGRHFYGQVPLPQNQFQQKKMLEPSRNDLCDCGSTLKYKNCCMAARNVPRLSEMNLLRYVLDTYSIEKLAEVARGQASLDAVADTAHQWTDEGHPERSAALLEPFFKRASITERYDLIFD